MLEEDEEGEGASYENINVDGIADAAADQDGLAMAAGGQDELGKDGEDKADEGNEPAYDTVGDTSVYVDAMSSPYKGSK